MIRALSGFVILLTLVACGSGGSSDNEPTRRSVTVTPASAAELPPTITPGTGNLSTSFGITDAGNQYLPGEENYYIHCAHCHGYEGEGQIPASIPNTERLGLHTVPPHDETGHTWLHPDELLVQVVMEGLRNPVHQYQMPGFASVLTEAEAYEIIGFIKGWWTDSQREYQAQINSNWEETRRDYEFDDDEE